MIKYVTPIVVVTVALLVTPGWADTSSMLGQPVVPQQYHQVGGSSTDTSDQSATTSQNTSTSAGNSASDDDAAQMAEIQAIEAQARQHANQQPSQSQQQMQTTVPASSSLSRSSFQSLQAEIVRLGQMSTSAQQILSDRLNGLSQQYQLLDKKMQSLTLAFQQQQQSQASAATTDDTPAAASVVNSASTSTPNYTYHWLWALSLLVVLLLLANSYLLYQLKRQQASFVAGDGDEGDEYDFMATEEAIPAKLDLARAYIQMGDEEQAEAALQEVLHSGNAAQVNQAQALLDSLSSNQQGSSNEE